MKDKMYYFKIQFNDRVTATHRVLAKTIAEAVLVASIEQNAHKDTHAMMAITGVSVDMGLMFNLAECWIPIPIEAIRETISGMIACLQGDQS